MSNDLTDDQREVLFRFMRGGEDAVNTPDVRAIDILVTLGYIDVRGPTEKARKLAAKTFMEDDYG